MSTRPRPRRSLPVQGLVASDRAPSDRVRPVRRLPRADPDEPIEDRLRSGGAQRRFHRRFGVEIPAGIRVEQTQDPGVRLVLDSPRWERSRTDGTRHLGSQAGALRESVSELVVGGFRCTSMDVLAVYILALTLRREGVSVPLTEAESVVRERAKEVCDGGLPRSTLALHRAFEGNPHGFEEFCAELLRGEGFQVETTGRGADGGVDLRAWRGETSWIGECKCFEPRNARVGRPVLQKLVGANLGEGADRMMVLSTAAFSANAVEYGLDHGMDLFAGKDLVRMWRRRIVVEEMVARPWLSAADLVPLDALERYAYSVELLRGFQWHGRQG